MLTETIRQKIELRDTLLSEYQEELNRVNEELSQLTINRDTAVSTWDMRLAAQLDREISKTESKLAEVQLMIRRVEESQRIDAETILSEWSARAKEHEEAIEKAKATADKASRPFITALRAESDALTALYKESKEWCAFAARELPDQNRQFERKILSKYAKSPLALFLEYQQNVSKE